MGCDKKRHREQTLLEHLIGTSEKLQKMGAPLYLQDAGLFHSVYGTSSYKDASTWNRFAIIDEIGEQAEEIVYLFSKIPQPRIFHISQMEPSQLKKDLLLLDRANQEDINDVTSNRLDFYNV